MDPVDTSNKVRAMRPYRAVAFDFDGLLFSTEDLYQDIAREMLGRRGLQLRPGLLDAMRGKSNIIALRVMIEWYGLNETPEMLLAETDELFEPLLRRALAPMPGARFLLNRLERARVPKAVVSSGRRSFIHSILERFGWEGRFDFVLTAEDFTRGKPHPEPYQLATARFGLQAAEVLALEDSLHGCASAAAAGNAVVAIPSSEAVPTREPGPLFVAKTLEDPRILDVLGISD